MSEWVRSPPRHGCVLQHELELLRTGLEPLGLDDSRSIRHAT